MSLIGVLAAVPAKRATHPSLEYFLVAAVAAAGSFLTTPIARGIAVKWGAIARPRDRDVHVVAIPRMGGVALFLGFVLALFTARQLPTLREAFNNGPEVSWILVAAGLICFIGALDDRFELDSLTKLAGQVLATGVMVTLGGVQLAEVYLPWGDNGTTVVLGQDLAIPVTILLTVLTINAINFIDGLDGLAAGVTVIGATSFFAFSYHLAQRNLIDVAATPTLLTAALAGTCIGFLPHNFFPARIFMGDSGSMLVGMMLSAAAVTATTNGDPQGFNGAGSLPLTLPLLIPAAVLAIPFIDLLLAVVRRVSEGKSPFMADKRHLHHRLLELGHSHRRAVLLLYYWSALLGFGGVAISIFAGSWVPPAMIAAGLVVGVLLLVVPGLQGRRAVKPVAQLPTEPVTAAVSLVPPATTTPPNPVTPAPAPSSPARRRVV